MKRTIGILVGLGGLIYVGTQLWAQTGGYAPPAAQAPAAAPQTRIALINLSMVMKNYRKFQAVQAELASKQSTFKVAYETYNKDMVAKQTEGNNPATTAARRDQLAKDIKDLQRKIQDLDEDAKKALTELQAQRMVQLYKEIEDAVAAHAKPRGIELVLHYGDGIGQDKYLPAFLGRRVANGACMPIYNVPGMDITDAVTNLLNQHAAAAAPTSTIPPVPGSQR